MAANKRTSVRLSEDGVDGVSDLPKLPNFTHRYRFGRAVVGGATLEFVCAQQSE